MDEHDPRDIKWSNLLLWLQQRGMDISSEGLPVAYRHFSEHGRGLAVNRDVQSNEVLFTIPTKCLLNIDTLFPWSKAHRMTDVTATQLLTSYLGLYKGTNLSLETEPFKPYLDTLPVDFDFHPLTWITEPNHEGSKYIDELPPSVRVKIFKVQERFIKDKTVVLKAFPIISEADCLWAWLNVNTRSLYYKCKRARSHSDHITLCPLLDLANHSNSAPNFNTAYHRGRGHPIPTMIAPPDGLRAEEEIHLLYGCHSNEVLFSEYGFVDHEAPNEIAVDAEMESLFHTSKDGEAKKAVLETRGYWGDWTLHLDPSPAHPSYRLIPALRLFHIQLNDSTLFQKWEETVAGSIDEVSSQNTEQLRNTLSELCTCYQSEADLWLSKHGSLCQSEDLADWPSIRRLWAQQRDVATGVLESILSGREF